MRKFVTSTILIVWSLSVDAACSRNDFIGSWYLTYRSSNPQQVGSCNFIVAEDMETSGSCYNHTYDYDIEIFDVSWSSIKKNCSFKVIADLDDGQRNVLTGKLNQERAIASGTMKSSFNGRVVKGSFKMHRN